jgi:hypothetical protein
MDKEKVVEALKLANAAMNEAKACSWEYESDNESSMAVMDLAGQIIVADAIRESVHPLRCYQVGVDMGKANDHVVMNLVDRVTNKNYPQLGAPDETGYWYAIFPDGSARLAEIEVIDTVKFKGIYKVHLLDHSGETMDTSEAKWVKINPQL